MNKQAYPLAPLLHYEVSGSGPTLVLLHGFLLSSHYWQDLSARLSDRYRVISLDLLGFGASPKPRNSRYDYEAHLKSIENTLAHIGLKDQTFTLMGHSMGALLALRYTRHHPHQVHRLLLANMPVWLTAKEARKDIMSNVIYRLGLMPVTQQFIWPAFRLAVRAQLLPRAVISDLHDRANYLFQHTARSRLRSFRNVILNARVEADLRAIEVQTVVLTGLNDRLAYAKNLQQFVTMPNITSQFVEGAHHLVKTKPELFIQLLTAELTGATANHA